MTQEKRNLNSAPSITGKRIYGYASKFNVRSENFGTPENPIYEIIEKGAFDFNHDNNHVLARSNGGKGTLKLSIDSVGLRYEFEAPDTQLGRDLVVSMKRGDITSSSFAFSVAKDGEKWELEGKAKIRRITKIARLYDCSVVTTPAYPDADANARSNKPTPPSSNHKINHLRRKLDLLK